MNGLYLAAMERLIEKDPELAAGLLADHADSLGLEGEDLLEQLLARPLTAHSTDCVLQVILRASLTEEQRSALLERLLELPAPAETLPGLARALLDRELPEEQRSALLESLLSRPAPEETLPGLARALLERELPEEQRAALLEGLLSRPVPEETLPGLARALLDNKPQKALRSELLDYLLAQPIPKELLPTLAEALLRTKPEKALRAELLRRLLDQPVPGETLPKLQQALLEQKLTKEQRAALLAGLLSGDGAQGTSSILTEALALEKPGKEQRAELLRRLLDQPIPGEAMDALAEALMRGKPGKEQRAELLNWLLAQSLPKESLSALAEAFLRGNPGKEQRSALLSELLSQPIPRELVSALVNALKEQSLPKEQRILLLDGLLKSPIPGEVVPALADRLKSQTLQKEQLLAQLEEEKRFLEERFYSRFDTFLRELEKAASAYAEPTVIFFGHLMDRRKAFFGDLASRLQERWPRQKVLFVDRGPREIYSRESMNVLEVLGKRGLLRMEEEHGGPAVWKSRLLELDYTEEMRALVESKPYIRRAIDIAKGAFGDTAPNYPEVLMCLCYRCYEALLSRVNVASVTIWNEFRFNHYLLAEMCRERGIGVSFMEFGSLPGTLVFDRRGQMGESAPAVDYEEFRQLGVTEEELARAEEVVAWLKASGLNRNQQPSEEMEEKEELKRLRPDRPVVLFAGQWDMASGMIPYTEDARKYHSPVFGSSLEALLALAKLAEKHDWNLIFKPHPSVQEEYDPAALPDNVILVKKYNINELIDLSDAVATILSSTAYVSLIRDRATVMLGYNQLRSKGCTYDAFRPEDVEKALTAAVEQGYTAEQRAAFIRHVAQMSKYYLYQDGEKRDGPAYGRPLKQLALEFRPASAGASPEKAADALFERELRRILSEHPGNMTRDAQTVIRRCQSFRKTYRLLAPWADRDRPAWKDGLSAAFRRAALEGIPEETVFLDMLCEGQLCYLDGACMEFIDRKQLWLMFREILFNEEYDCDFETDEPFVLDCGTNIGLAVYYIKHRWPKARVVGFEPWSVAWGCASRNAERNGWSDVIIHRAALGPEKGTMTLTSMMENTLASTLTRRMDRLIREREYEAHTEEVPVTPLSPWLDQRVDFLKMDIEGLEAQVLRECGDRLDRVERIFCEYHYGRELEDNSLAEILRLLEDRGFCFEVATASAFTKTARRRFAHTGKNISELIWAKRIAKEENDTDETANTLSLRDAGASDELHRGAENGQ